MAHNIWYGVGAPPDGYKSASMKEAMEANKIFKYGEKKIDNVILRNIEKQQRKKYPDLFIDYNKIDNENMNSVKNKSEDEIEKLIQKFKKSGLLSKLPKTNKYINKFYDKLKNEEVKQRKKEEEYAQEYIDAIEDAEDDEEEQMRIFRFIRTWQPKFYTMPSFLKNWMYKMEKTDKIKNETEELNSIKKNITKKDIDDAIGLYTDKFKKKQKDILNLINNNKQPTKDEFENIKIFIAALNGKIRNLNNNLPYIDNKDDRVTAVTNTIALRVIYNTVVKYMQTFKDNLRTKRTKKDKTVKEVKKDDGKLILPYDKNDDEITKILNENNYFKKKNLCSETFAVPLFWEILFKHNNICEIIDPPISDKGLEFINKSEMAISGINGYIERSNYIKQKINFEFKKGKNILSYDNEIIDIIKNSKKRFVMFLFTIFINEPHQNCIIIDKSSKTLERYDSQGAFSLYDAANKEINKELTAFAEKCKLKFIFNDGGYIKDYIDRKKYKKSLDKNDRESFEFMELTQGLQATEEDKGVFRGLCISWALFNFEIRLMNPNLTAKQIMEKLLKDRFDSDNKKIKNYMLFYIYNSIKNLENIVGDKFYSKLNLSEIFNKIQSRYIKFKKEKAPEKKKEKIPEKKKEKIPEKKKDNLDTNQLYREQEDDEDDEDYFKDIIKNLLLQRDALVKKKKTKKDDEMLNIIEDELVELGEKVNKWFGWNSNLPADREFYYENDNNKNDKEEKQYGKYTGLFF